MTLPMSSYSAAMRDQYVLRSGMQLRECGVGEGTVSWLALPNLPQARTLSQPKGLRSSGDS